MGATREVLIADILEIVAFQWDTPHG